MGVLMPAPKVKAERSGGSSLTMAVDATRHPHAIKIAVAAQPTEVEAGTRSTLKVEVACSEGCPLDGRRLALRDAAGLEVAQAVLSASPEPTHVADLEFTAPTAAGTYRLEVLLVPGRGSRHAPEVATALAVTVVPHRVVASTWKVPTAIVAGERATIHVGAKCSSSCSLAGRAVVIRDHLDRQVWAGTLNDKPWPGASALYFTEATLDAPATEGDHYWHLDVPGWDGGMPHAAGTFAFLVRVVPPAQAEVTVVATDHASGSPIAGLQVVMHPYRAVTDRDGVARVKVVKGTFKLFVTGFNYIGFQTVIDVVEDVTVNAELVVEQEVDHYDSYYR